MNVFHNALAMMAALLLVVFCSIRWADDNHIDPLPTPEVRR